MMSSRHRWLLPALAILLAAAACTTFTNDLLQEVGTTVLLMTDTDLRPQSTTDPDGTIQVVEWELTQADLDLGDGSPVADMLFADACRYTDTVFVSPTSQGRCSGGLVIGTNEDAPISATLTLTFTMTVRRAKHDLLTPWDDEDTDEVRNEIDLCPYVRNPDQEDENSDGLGDACSVRDPVSGTLLPDTDGDGWPDFIDNCIWEPNQDQADTMGVGADGIADGIGDRCEEQSADVALHDSTEIVLVLTPFELTQLQRQITYLTVDFRSQNSLRNCWDGSPCELTEDAIRFCVNTSFPNAVGGCL